jgi:hypothetical protein
MMIAQATLIAGAKHERYAAGTKMPAIMFLNATDEDEAEAIASRELSQLGWATMQIERYKDVTDYKQFDERDPVLTEAFRNAQATGFGIIVFP